MKSNTYYVLRILYSLGQIKTTELNESSFIAFEDYFPDVLFTTEFNQSSISQITVIKISHVYKMKWNMFFIQNQPEGYHKPLNLTVIVPPKC